MPKKFTVKIITVVIIFLLSLIYITPSLVKKLPSWWIGFLPSEKIHLGLDLQGGIHFILEVEVDKAITSSIERANQELIKNMKDSKIIYSLSEIDSKGYININLISEEEYNKFEKKKFKILQNFIIDSVKKQINGHIVLTFKLNNKSISYLREQTTSQALETIRNRIDQFGVTEPEIIPQTENRILVQLPGIKDPQRAISLIGKTALLEFKLINDIISNYDIDKIIIPSGSELNYINTIDKNTGRFNREPIITHSRASMTGETISDAHVQIDPQNGAPYVIVSFNDIGKNQFAELTTNNVKKRLAIILDDKVQSVPLIQEPIIGGEARITGSFTIEEARDLAVVLRSGALPAPVKILEERIVGPSLGSDSINAALLAAIIGTMSVFLFMTIYYKLSGLAANFAVILNIVIIIACMTGIQATLTLPGIAGIILTIGMAVDANVLINERIREELRAGKTNIAAVDAGYSRATITIFDANITTAITALVLYHFGTGPIKGFAVTLIIGLTSSMFTAIVVTRLLFDWILYKYQPKKISI